MKHVHALSSALLVVLAAGVGFGQSGPSRLTSDVLSGLQFRSIVGSE
jgi:hypothetical protein